jgi:hypothetical protein
MDFRSASKSIPAATTVAEQPLDLTEGSHPGEHLSVTLPGRGKALAPQVDRSVGQTTLRRLAVPAYPAVDRYWSQTARELALIY